MKLPDINYGNRATPLRARGPEDAVMKARGIQEIASAITETVNVVHKINQDYAITQATAAANNELSQLRREYESREFFTADEVKRFDLDNLVKMVDGVDPDGNDISREVIPAHEVYPLLVDRQMEYSIRSGAGKIRNPQAREKWTTEMNARRMAVVDKVTLAAQDQAVAYTLKERQLDIAEAQDGGNFDDAAELINVAYAGNEPARRSALEENNILKEKSRIDLALMSDDPSDIEDLMIEITSPEYLETTNLNTTELRQYYGAASARQAAAASAAKEQRKARSDALTMELLAAVKLGKASQATVIDNKPNLTKEDFKYLMGQTDPSATSSFSTPAPVKAQFEVQVLRLETGDYEGDYFERVDELQRWLIDTAYAEDPVTGQAVQGISGTDVNTWRNRLKDLEQEPFKTDAFKSVSKELQLRVLRGSEEMMSFGAVDAEAANLYAEAVEDLRNYVRDNGGIKADVTTWKRERMPYYLSESSKQSFYKLPRRVRDDAIMAGDMVDYKATLESLRTSLARTTDLTEQQMIRESITDFEDWAKTTGVYYVTR